MRLALRVEELLLANWGSEPDAIARVLPGSLIPAAANGEHLVSIAALRFGGGRLGSAPVPPFSQLNVRTCVEWEGEQAVFFVRSFVTLGGLGGIAFGAPFRPARLRFRPGLVQARAAGVSLPYRLAGPGEPGELAHLELGLFESHGLRAFRVARGRARWRKAEPAGPVRADVLLALGFEPVGEPTLFHATGGSFETHLPPSSVTSGERAEYD